MISTIPVITNQGAEMMLRALAGEHLTITKFTIGSGLMQDGTDMRAVTALADEKLAFDISSVQPAGGEYARIEGIFNTNSVTTAFRWSEIGLWAKMDGEREQLYCYGNCGADGEVIVPGNGSSMYVEQSVVLVVTIGSLSNVSVQVGESGIYVTKDAFNAHVQDMNNPHQTTAAQVGLGNVENASPSNGHVFLPSTVADTNIISGDTLGNQMAKTKKAVGIFVGHMENTNNPHKVTLAQVLGGAGIVPIQNGGTNASTAAQARTNLGITWANLTGKPSTFAPDAHTHSAADITSGALKIERGGTNASTAAQARANLGITWANLTGKPEPISNTQIDSICV